MPICERCQAEMEPDEAREYAGQQICEDCYMDALSPTRTCDPWATYTASRLLEQVLNPAQEKIIGLINSQGQATPDELVRATGLKWEEVQREIAALRHMEMVGGKRLPDKSVVYLRFDQAGQ
jgi:predicted transcriptional regulator